MHGQFDEAFARHDLRLRAAWQAAAEAPANRRPWQELASAAREIEADSVLRGEYLFAYLSAKIDAAVTTALDGPWPPPEAESRFLEVRDLVMLLEVPRAAWARRVQSSTLTTQHGPRVAS
jgi:hypothetical protein